MENPLGEINSSTFDKEKCVRTEKRQNVETTVFHPVKGWRNVYEAITGVSVSRKLNVNA